jgi:ribosomal protein S18 acetylase RimI-like enzyme
MNIRYDHGKDIKQDTLKELFLSIGWGSSRDPVRLQKAIQTSHSVVTAWDDNKLVGLVNTIADDAMIVYIPYIVVRPEYQKKGIGQQLIRTILDEYRDYTRIVLIALGEVIGFYEKCGFQVGKERYPMYITHLR